MIHYRKIPRELVDSLFARGLVAHDDDTYWLQMEAKTADLYMSILAKYLAYYNTHDNQYMIIGTDKDVYMRQSYCRPIKSESGICFDLILSRLLPIPSMSVGLDKIMDFKIRRRDELLRFRFEIDSLERALKACATQEDVAHTIESFRERMELQITTLARVMTENRFDIILSSFKSIVAMEFPALIASLAATQAGAPKWITAVGTSLGGIMGITQSIVNFRRNRDAIMQQSGFSYLYHARKGSIVR